MRVNDRWNRRVLEVEGESYENDFDIMLRNDVRNLGNFENCLRYRGICSTRVYIHILLLQCILRLRNVCRVACQQVSVVCTGQPSV